MMMKRENEERMKRERERKEVGRKVGSEVEIWRERKEEKLEGNVKRR